MIVRLPRGYQRLEGFPSLTVAHQQYARAVREVLAGGTWHDWAAAHPERREYRGRGPVFSAPLPGGGPRVVVRHARRGGLLAPLLRDLYLPPTPAPSELVISAILQAYRVPTPPVVGFATYRVATVLRRVDVATLEIEGRDLATELAARPDPSAREPLLVPLATLLAALLNAGAWHQDLNARNILLARQGGDDPVAAVLDVDRVRFSPGGDPHIRDANFSRLRRSLQRLASQGIPVFGEPELAAIDERVREIDAARASERAAITEESIA